MVSQPTSQPTTHPTSSLLAAKDAQIAALRAQLEAANAAKDAEIAALGSQVSAANSQRDQLLHEIPGFAAHLHQEMRQTAEVELYTRTHLSRLTAAMEHYEATNPRFYFVPHYPLTSFTKSFINASYAIHEENAQMRNIIHPPQTRELHVDQLDNSVAPATITGTTPRLSRNGENRRDQRNGRFW